MEYRDLYDENRKPTGKKILKGGKVPSNMYYITVVVFIINSRGEHLLQINKKYNLWSITGGHPKSGESSIEGIINEIKEELGIDTKQDELNLFKTVKTADDFIDLYYCKKDININDIIKQEEEVGDIKWFSTEEINDLVLNQKIIPSHINFLKLFLKLITNI